MSPRSPQEAGGSKSRTQEDGGRAWRTRGREPRTRHPCKLEEAEEWLTPTPPAPEATRPTRAFTSGGPESRTLESGLLERPETPSVLLSACVIFSPEIQAPPPGLCDLGQVSSPCWGRFPCHPWAAAGGPLWRAFSEPPTPATQNREWQALVVRSHDLTPTQAPVGPR